MVFEFGQQFFPLFKWLLAPALKGLLGGDYGLVDILLVADRDGPELLAGRGVCIQPWRVSNAVGYRKKCGSDVLTPWCCSFASRFLPSTML